MTLPDFIIGGAARSGTHALYSWLIAHPDVEDAPRREIRFFDRNYHRGLDWYRGRFAGSGIAGEVSPRYLSHPEAATRMAADVPDVRLIFILRDPVERAYSDYWMHRARGLDSRSFEAAIEEPDGRDVYVETGDYAEHLRRFHAHFDRVQVLPLIFEDMVEHPAATFTRVVRFIGADPSVVPETVGSKVNVHVMFRSRRVRRWAGLVPEPVRGLALRAVAAVNTKEAARPPMAAETRDRLRSYYEDQVADLEQMLGRDLPWGRTNA